MEDSKIIALFFERNEDAIRHARDKYGKYCLTIAFNILKNREDSEEVLSDVLFKAWNSIPPAHPNRLSVYLGKAVRNTALNKYESINAKKRGSGEIPVIADELCEIIPSSSSTEDILDEKTFTELINRFLEKCSKEARIIFVKRYWYLMPIKEICKELGIGESKTKMILMRTRNELKGFLETEGFLV